MQMLIVVDHVYFAVETIRFILDKIMKMYLELFETMEKYTKLNPNEIYDVNCKLCSKRCSYIFLKPLFINLEKSRNKSL